jgi:hypothetical protein
MRDVSSRAEICNAMKKERTKKEELRDFLASHCELKTAAGGLPPDGKAYLFHTRDCVLFMAEGYIHGMRNAIGQNEEVMNEARKNGDFSKLIMVYNWSAPEPGMDAVQIPETLVDALTKEQASVFLRNLQRIRKDIDEGKALKAALLELFGGKAEISASYALDGERQFFITGMLSPADRKGYAERYAEHAATNILFDLPKALNAGLQAWLPEYARGRHFMEGRSNFNKKLRYGADVNTELLLSDEGAKLFTEIAREHPGTGNEIRKLFRQAVLDPFGMSLKYYLGKHALIKLPGDGG